MVSTKEPHIYQKIFTEVRLPLLVDLFDKKSEIIKLFWPNEYEHWSIENNNITIRFYNDEDPKKSSEHFLINPKRIIFSVENPPTNNYFLEKFTKFYKAFISKFPINENIIRLGVRTFTCINGISFKEIVNLSNKSIFFQENFIKNIGNDKKHEDFSIILDYQNCKIVLGPMKNTEANPYLQEFLFKDKLKDEFLFFDIDVNEKNVPSKKLLEIFSDLDKKIKLYPMKIYSYISGEIENGKK